MFPNSGRTDRITTTTTTTRRPRTTTRRIRTTTRRPTTTTTERPATTRRTTRSTRPPRPRTRATAAPRPRPRPRPPPPPPPQASSPQVADPSFSIPGSDRGSWLPGIDLINFSLWFFLLYASLAIDPDAEEAECGFSVDTKFIFGGSQASICICLLCLNYLVSSLRSILHEFFRRSEESSPSLPCLATASGAASARAGASAGAAATCTSAAAPSSTGATW